jgi:pimeloyl-ACP methyl ester carboxylesterase
MRYAFFFLLWLSFSAHCQTLHPAVQDASAWQVINRLTEPVNDQGRKAIQFNSAPGAGLMLLKGVEFSYGSIEFDVKGKNVIGQSFVGIAFHIQRDTSYEGIYFRPFNFLNPDTIRRWRAVQYICEPDFPWDRLREGFPGTFENKVNPVPDPDHWFHAKITIDETMVKVYVNRSTIPCLQVKRISSTSSGLLGLWVGEGSAGTFANVEITPAKPREKIPYGHNSKAGKYIKSDDANIYYEVYGSGPPLVMLHGGVYGYIDEFEPFIPKLAEHYQVICVATRGHGKSSIGNTPFTWAQRANDAYRVVRAITKDSVTLLGFSDGAYAAYQLAASHPELVKKLIAIGAGYSDKDMPREKLNYTPENLLSQAKDLFETRLALMPEPKRWGECLSMLNKLYNDDQITADTYRKIKCPTLIMSGSQDGYHTIAQVKKLSQLIPNNQLKMIDNCDHVVFYCRFPEVWMSIVSFLDKNIVKPDNSSR